MNLQEIYAENIVDGRKSLIPGRLRYSDLDNEASVGDEFTLDVLAKNRWGASASPSPSVQPPASEEDIKVGGLIGVKVHCSGARARCVRLSTERQNVLGRAGEEPARWQWSIAPKEAGPLTVTLTASTYYRSSNIVLSETDPLSQTVEVTTPPGEKVGSATNWVLGLLTALGGVGGLLSAVEFGRRRRSRREQRPAAQDAEPQS
ncbi:hypothetical protein [Streptomyces winkii]|uniref:hypothetical protein n=1 Tax=Streptomyces winkii TaxID=3051178 RepID=UPI0028D4E5CF|nr:hypothetical protein [Streptomyces sp. DSM 40971]